MSASPTSADTQPYAAAPRWVVRQATTADYPEITRLHNDYYGTGWPMTQASLLVLDRGANMMAYESTPARIASRWVVQRSEPLVGIGLIQWRRDPDPHRYALNFVIDPNLDESPAFDALRQQVFARMLNWINLRPHRQQAHTLRTHARSDRAADLAFLAKQGFVEVLREQDALLELAHFDPTSHLSSTANMAARGIKIVTLASLPSGDVTEHALFELEQELRRDVPGVSSELPNAFVAWRALRLEAPDFRPESCFIAIQGESFVGLSYLTTEATPQWLSQRLTGVRQSHRRQGIAAALKLAGIDYARTHGYTHIRTASAVENQAMRDLNTKMGFVPQPVWVHLAKTCT